MTEVQKNNLHRAGWIDITRIMMMLAIIDCHSPITLSPVWNLYLFPFNRCVVFFIFLAALFSKNNTKQTIERALWLLACYLFWGITLTFFIHPLSTALSHLANEGTFCFNFPNFRSAPWDKIILWDHTKVFPWVGPLWFFRFLVIFTLATPLLRKIPTRILWGSAIIFYCLRYTPLVEEGAFQATLPFIINSKLASASTAAYLIGLAVSKAGGLTTLCKYFDKGLVPSLLIVSYMGALQLSRLLYCPFTDCDPFTDFLCFLMPCALCCVFYSLRQVRYVGFIFKYASIIAPCIFTVYILHMPMGGMVVDLAKCLSPNYTEFLKTWNPIIIFALCWVCWRLMLFIPHCSMLLCFNKKSKGIGKERNAPTA